MLPLWIIDITKQSDRQLEFLKLLCQVDHVFVPKELRTLVATVNEQSKQDTDNGEAEHQQDDAEHQNNDAPLSNIGVSADDTKQVGASKLSSEEVDAIEKKEALRNAVIKGDYWHYTHLDNPFNEELPEDYQEDLEKILDEVNRRNENEQKEPINEEEQQTYLHAKKLYRFQETMLDEGKAFIHRLRSSNVKPYQTINVIVLGDARDELTQSVFASIAAILTKEKGRFMPAHIHQGLSITGCLFVPCNVNAYKVDERNKVLHLLDEIEVQHNLPSMRGYDHMMLYQDVQNRTECAYTILSEQQQAQYLMQCLVHMFLACDINYPLLSGTSSEESFYFSMGAASVYFDMDVEDNKEANRVAIKLLETLKADGTGEMRELQKPLVDKDDFTADMYVGMFSKIAENMDVEDVPVGPFRPHPIVDYLNKNLKRVYYQFKLRYLPADLLRGITASIEKATSDRLDMIAEKSKKAFDSLACKLKPAITRRLAKVTEVDGALVYIETLLKKMQEMMSTERERIRVRVEEQFWLNIMDKDSLAVPRNQKDYFEEYHDIYINDIDAKNDGAGCAGAKNEALLKLKDILSQEKTTLATLVRIFFMSIMLVLCLLPLLDMLSPGTIDLGNVKKNAFYWGMFIFIIPALIQILCYFLYMRKRNAAINVLKAYYLHDAYARLANRVEYEANEFYMKGIALEEEYLKRCKQIREEITIKENDFATKPLIPDTMFNQPLNGGVFNEEEIIPAKEIECRKIRVRSIGVPTNELTTANYFLLINFFNDIIAKLFDGVSVTESHERVFNSKTGDHDFKSRQQLLDEKAAAWQTTKALFRKDLDKGIKNEMLPREYPTAGEKLIQYKNKIEDYTLLEPLMSYAATNGEIVAHSDTEYADIKVNKQIDDLSEPYLPLINTRLQVAPYNPIFQKFIFITRWRCFSHFSYNRILPNEDFDLASRQKVNHKAAKAAEKARAEEIKRLSLGAPKKGKKTEIHTTVLNEDANDEYKAENYRSSLILWAVMPDDNSGQWLNIFPSDHFSKAYLDREKYREVLNTND